MNSYQLLQNEDCDIEIHNTQQEKKWLKKKRILEQKKETSANMERISQITIALNEYQERINPTPKVTKPKVTKPKVTKNDSNNFLEREFHNNKKYWNDQKISYDADLSVRAKEERKREQRDNIIKKEIRWKRKIYTKNIKQCVFYSWAKETTDEIEYKINQKMKWVMYKKRIYILKIYLYGWKKRCEIIKMNIKMKIVRNRVICVNHFTMWKNMVQQTCPICIGPIQDKYVTSCNHEFCKSCISKWLCTKKNCPMCREKIEPIESVIGEGSLLDEMAITPTNSEIIYREDLWRMLISGHNLFNPRVYGRVQFRTLYNQMGYTSADFEMSDFSRDSFWDDVNLRYNILLGRPEDGTISVGMSPNMLDCFTNLYNIALEYRRLYPEVSIPRDNAVSTE